MIAKNYPIIYARNPLTPAFRLATERPHDIRQAAENDTLAKSSEAALRHAVAKLYYRYVFGFWYPDPGVGWIPDALRQAFRLHHESKFSVVFSSAWPASTHLAAAAFSRVHNVPWIADFRDLWTGYPYGRGRARKLLDKIVESRVLRRAAAITTVSEGLRQSLIRLHGRRHVHVIPNASAAEDWLEISNTAPKQFSILYAGILYGGQRNPDIVFDAVRELRAERHPVGQATTFDFYGSEPDLVLAAAERYGIGDAVKVHARAGRQTILRSERGAAVLLILLKMDAAVASEYGSKLFEYAGARRPILALGPAGSVVGEYLRESGLGTLVSTVAECKEVLRSMHARYVAGCYEPTIESGWKPFSADDLAGAFAALFERASSQ